MVLQADIIHGKPGIMGVENKAHLHDIFELTLKRHAIAAAYEMYDNVKAQSTLGFRILEELEPIIRIRPRPPRPID